MDRNACPEFLFLGISLHNHKCAINPQDYRRSCRVGTRWPTPWPTQQAPPPGHSWLADQSRIRQNVERRDEWSRNSENRERTQIRLALSSWSIHVRFSCSLMFEFYVKPQIPYINSRFYLFNLSLISVTYHPKSSGWYNVNTTQTNVVTFPLTYGWQAVKRFYSSVRFVKLYHLFAKLCHAHISSI